MHSDPVFLTSGHLATKGRECSRSRRPLDRVENDATSQQKSINVDDSDHHHSFVTLSNVTCAVHKITDAKRGSR